MVWIRATLKDPNAPSERTSYTIAVVHGLLSQYSFLLNMGICTRVDSQPVHLSESIVQKAGLHVLQGVCGRLSLLTAWTINRCVQGTTTHSCLHALFQVDKPGKAAAWLVDAAGMGRQYTVMGMMGARDAEEMWPFASPSFCNPPNRHMNQCFACLLPNHPKLGTLISRAQGAACYGGLWNWSHCQELIPCTSVLLIRLTITYLHLLPCLVESVHLFISTPF